MKVYKLIIVIIAVILTIPFISIAALNTLFNLNIGYNIGTYFSMLWVLLVLSYGNLTISSK